MKKLSLASIRREARKKGIRFKIAVSFLVVLSVPFLFTIGYQINAAKAIKEQSLNLQKTILNQIQTSFDARLRDIKETALQITYGSRFKEFILLKEGQQLDQYSLSLTIKDLKNYRLTNEYITDICIYNEAVDKILTSSAVYDTRLFYDTYIKTEKGKTYEEWLWSLRSNTEQRDFSLENFREGEESNTTMSYILPYPINNMSGYTGSLIIVMDRQKLFHVINDLQWIKGSQFFVFKSNGTQMLSSNENSVAKYLDEAKLSKNLPVVYDRENKQRFVVLSAHSYFATHKYVFAVPYEFFSQADKLQRNQVILFLFSIVLCAVFVAVFTQKQYEPIENILEQIKKSNMNISGLNDDEYNLITEAIKKAVSDKKVFERKTDRLTREKQYNFLKNVLKGEISDLISMEDYFDANGFQFQYEYFIAMIFEPESLGMLFDSETNEMDYDTLELLNLVYTNILEELVNEKYNGYVVGMAGRYICVVNFEQNHQNTVEKFAALAKNAAQTIREHFLIQSTVGISGVHTGVYSLQQAYMECTQTLEYVKLNGSDWIACYPKVSKKINYNKMFFYSNSQRSAFKNQLLGENYEEAKEIFREMIREIQEKEVLLQKADRYALAVFSNMVLFTIDEIKAADENTKVKFMERLTGAASLTALEEQVCEIIEEIAQEKERVRNDGRYLLVGKIEKYVNENYGDEELNVAKIADFFGLDFKYISSFFKKYKGIGILEYIHTVRMDHAKLLLRETDLKIQEITTRVGCRDSNSFIRMFKRYEGMSPGKYRECIRGEAEISK